MDISATSSYSQKIGFGVGGLHVHFLQYSKNGTGHKLLTDIFIQNSPVHSHVHFPKNRNVSNVLIFEVIDMFNPYFYPFEVPSSRTNSAAGFQNLFFDLVKPSPKNKNANKSKSKQTDPSVRNNANRCSTKKVSFNARKKAN